MRSRSGCLSPFGLAYTEFVNEAPPAVHDTSRLPFHESTAHSRSGSMLVRAQENLLVWLV